MQLCSEEFNLSVKRLSRGISGTIDEIVEYFLTSSLRTPRNINLTIFLGKNAKNRAFLV